jgi:hypothetical protein
MSRDALGFGGAFLFIGVVAVALHLNDPYTLERSGFLEVGDSNVRVTMQLPHDLYSYSTETRTRVRHAKIACEQAMLQAGLSQTSGYDVYLRNLPKCMESRSGVRVVIWSRQN